MRFAITGTDRFIGVFESFVRAGWQPVRLFTVPTSQHSRESNNAVIDFAGQNGASVQFTRMTQADLEYLQACDCDVLIVAGYKWRIGDWSQWLKYAVNFHPSPLPEARGPNPMARAILEQRTKWAVTCHKVAPEFDTGDILAAQNFVLQPDECYESLDLKMQIAARRLAATVAANFETLWYNSTPQTTGSYWSLPTIEDWTLSFTQPVETILRRVRAFGPLGTRAFVNDRWLGITRAMGWTEAHRLPPGTVVHVDQHRIVVAAADGFIGLLEWRM